MKMVDQFDEPIGTEQYVQMQEKERARKEAKSVITHMGGHAEVAVLVAVALLEKGKGQSIQDGLQMTPYIKEKPYQSIEYVRDVPDAVAVSKIAGWFKDANSNEVSIFRKKCHEQSAKIKFLEEEMGKMKSEADASIQAHKKALRDRGDRP